MLIQIAVCAEVGINVSQGVLVLDFAADRCQL